MNKFVSIVAALALSIGIAFAQQTPVPPTAQPSTAATVKKWTTKQWNAAKSEWAKDKAKWAGCQQQSTDKKLAGRKSWSFLYTCMTT